MKEETLANWLSSLAAKTPAPGGGAAAALAAAVSAALLGMVTNYTTGSKWADREARMMELNREAERLRSQALSLADEDAASFAHVGAAYKLPAGSDQEKAVKKQAIQHALEGAALPPQKISELCTRLAEICEELAGTANQNVISDVAVASSLAASALESAIINIEINEIAITDISVKQSLQTVIAAAAASKETADNITANVRKSMRKSK